MALAVLVVAALFAGGSPPADEASAGQRPTRESASTLARPSVAAVRAHRRIRVDGRADDEVWQRAPVGGGLVVRRPAIGASPAYDTTFQVAYDERALYVLVRCEAPGGGVARSWERDSWRIFSDDVVSVKVDPGRDYRTGYSFAVNAGGAQFDAIAFNDGNTFEAAWDGIWEAEAHQREGGFDLEYRIPFAILGVPKGDDLTLGFNITRDTSTGETWDWSLLEPPLSPMATSRFGTVTGVVNRAASRLLAFTPFALLRGVLEEGRPRVSLDPRRDPSLAAGGEVRVQVGEASYAEVSALTDFAEAEVDTLQVQTGRFPLFFPERRQFFLSGLDVFDFGVPAEGQPFFSRRIGLEEGSPVPLLGGAKLYGRSGDWRYGLLEVLTYPDAASFVGAPFLESSTVARAKVEATRSVTLGGLGLGRLPIGTEGAGGDRAHGMFGVDGRVVAFSSRLVAYGFGLASVAPASSSTPPNVGREDREEREEAGPLTAFQGLPQDVGFSGYGRVAWQGQFLRPQADILWSDETFAAPLGFYRRPGTGRLSASLPLTYQPEMLGLREIAVNASGTAWMSADATRALGHSLNLAAGAEWANNAYLGVTTTRTVDVVDGAFPLYGYEVAAGVYDTTSAGFTFQLPTTLPVYAVVSGATGGFYSGAGSELYVTTVLRPSKVFYGEASFDTYVGDLAPASSSEKRPYAFSVARTNAVVSVTRDIAWTTKAQLSLAPGGEQAVVQSRLRWRYWSGSDLFVVYRLAQPLRLDRPVWSQPAADHAVTVKVTFYMPSGW